MKLAIHILFFTVLLLQNRGTNGNLKELFGSIHNKIHDTSNKVKQDLNNIFHPSNDNNRARTVVTTLEYQTQEGSKIIYPDDDQITQEFSKATVPTAPPVTSPTSQYPSTVNQLPEGTKSAVNTSDPHDGRENFAAGCLAGYYRTPDGRCKPSF